MGLSSLGPCIHNMTNPSILHVAALTADNENTSYLWK
jgi:hypothetical protein